MLARKQAAEAQAAQAAQAEAERKAKAAPPKPVKATPPPPSTTFEATAYTADCNGCSGITASGYDVRNTIYAPSGRRVIAADPAVLAMGTVVVITLANGASFEAEVLDRGGAIKGHRIDLLMATYGEAIQFGRQAVQIRRK